ncbi:MAG: hypothetical protein QCI38_08325, partial [Candidatus Thermoplasmatota archaeon]|nr:hypothetical protein [Candidatus Thermoplasmatota archaeon]
IGEPGNGTGVAYIFYGWGSWSGAYDTGDANVTITGESSGDRFGESVAIAGDVNGDGTDDVVVGAPGRDYESAALDATVFSQDFTGVATGSIPTGWTRTDATRWSVQATANAGGTSPELRFQYSSTATGVYRCYTPAIDTTGYTQLSLSFKHFVNNYDGTGYPYSVRVETSTDGITWTTAWSVSPTGTANIGPATVSSTIAGDKGAGSNTLYISWTFSGQTFGINYWYIDDIVLTGTGIETEYGAAYVFYGSDSMPSSASDADEKYIGTDSTGIFGFAVAGVGDVDGSGYDNFAIGEPGNDKAYINQKASEVNASGETAVTGTVTNTYTSTQTQDDITYQSILETSGPSSIQTSETRYMRGVVNEETENGLTAYSLNTTQSSTAQSAASLGSAEDVYAGIRVWIRNGAGTEYELTSGTAVGIASVLANNNPGAVRAGTTWTPPEKSMNTTDTIVVRLYQGTTSPPGTQIAVFTTEQLGALQLDAVAWQPYYFIISSRTNQVGSWVGWGDSTYNTRIENFAYRVSTYSLEHK